MTHHINRWLLAFAAAYLFLLPTNAVRFVHSITFGRRRRSARSSHCASRGAIHVTRIPLAGPSILVPLFAWARMVVRVARLVGRSAPIRAASSSAR